jgi:hypothetical protein
MINQVIELNQKALAFNLDKLKQMNAKLKENREALESLQLTINQIEQAIVVVGHETLLLKETLDILENK